MSAWFQRILRPRAVSAALRRRAQLGCEALEDRVVPSSLSVLDLDNPNVFQPVIVAGSANGTPADSPGNRVDPNVTSSPFAGVGSLEVRAIKGRFVYTYWGTATAIGPQHVLTAAHMFDINNDGQVTSKDGIISVTFRLNLTGGPTSIAGSSWQIHPNYTGFAKPSVNDDIAVVKLSAPLPAGVPFYSLDTAGPTVHQTQFVMVGYGRSGDGVNGYYVSASLSVKRVGVNVVDAFYGQDDRGKPAASEVFRFDFDGPTGNGSLGGGATLGNDIETQLGPGDSGGPSFILLAGVDSGLATSYVLAGVNTYTQGAAPYFGSLGGGMIVAAYRSFIDTATDGVTAQVAVTASEETQESESSGSSTGDEGTNPLPGDAGRRLILFLSIRTLPLDELRTNAEAARTVQALNPAPIIFVPPSEPLILKNVHSRVGMYIDETGTQTPHEVPPPVAPDTGGQSQQRSERPAPSLIKLDDPWRRAIDAVFAEELEMVVNPVNAGYGSEAEIFESSDPISLAGMAGLAAMVMGGVLCSHGYSDALELARERRRTTIPAC